MADDPDLVRTRAEGVTGDHVATMIYTSGTTGRPKGVLLPHSAWGYTSAALNSLGVLRPDDLEFRWLPMAHVFGTTLLAAQIGVATPPRSTVGRRRSWRTWSRSSRRSWGAVPRIFEKIYAAVNAMAKAGGPEQAAAFAQGVAAAEKYTELKMAGAEIPADVAEDTRPRTLRSCPTSARPWAVGSATSSAGRRSCPRISQPSSPPPGCRCWRATA